VATYVFDDKVTATGNVPTVFVPSGTISQTSNVADCPLCH
jgi:hypothetical protein